MSTITYEGVVKDGRVRLPESVRLQESATVYVVVPNFDVQRNVHVHSPKLVNPEDVRDFRERVTKGEGR